MPALLVNFRLSKPTTDPDYAKIIGVIKQYSYSMLGEGAVAIATNESPAMVFTKFKPYLGERDILLITSLNKPHYGLHKPSVIQWIEENASSSTATGNGE
ncbi:hypothetical protein [Echinimonas agarilytica]|uniref:Uncharacterized protein n=1 Tax=Echinimonas agarilytica TaxID=1215918 RepID=A0AA42B9K7_9GAMM|nr:hypothetical protein [Echinimonas agarilytica]MCM2681176.1 hypothetical protein [Echinimonas agarilytica]